MDVNAAILTLKEVKSSIHVAWHRQEFDHVKLLLKSILWMINVKARRGLSREQNKSGKVIIRIMEPIMSGHYVIAVGGELILWTRHEHGDLSNPWLTGYCSHNVVMSREAIM